MCVRIHFTACATDSPRFIAVYRFYGITNLQTFLYFRTFPDDKWWNKIGVFWLWYADPSRLHHILMVYPRFLDTIHIILCVYMVYYYVVTEFGNPFALLTLNWSLKVRLCDNA